MRGWSLLLLLLLLGAVVHAFAFALRRFGNWFSILMGGLRNMSNTKYMSAGAAMGAGIYTALQLATSMGYSASRNSWQHSLFNNCACVSLCEIVDRPEDFTAGGQNTPGSLRGAAPPAGSVWVIAKENIIATRFLLLVPSQVASASSLAVMPPVPPVADGPARRAAAAAAAAVTATTPAASVRPPKIRPRKTGGKKKKKASDEHVIDDDVDAGAAVAAAAAAAPPPPPPPAPAATGAKRDSTADIAALSPPKKR